VKRSAALILVVCLLGWSVTAFGQDVPSDAETILERVRSGWQGDSFHAVLELEITLAGATKQHSLEVWTYGEDYVLMRILAPEIDEGSGYLQIADDLWFYSPSVGVSIPLPSMGLSKALFGSGPSLEDLSQGTLSDDYEVTAETQTDEVGAITAYVLTLIPHADAPVVYGKLVLTASPDYVIRELVYFDQRDTIIRTATFANVVFVGEAAFPTEVLIVDSNGDQTVQRILEPEFDIPIDETFFTLERLEGAE